jgi:NUMOD4 motif/HNH endonuclease
MTETWKPVVGWEDRYQVSDRGRVRSIDHPVKLATRWGGTTIRWVKGKMLKPGATQGGYRQVQLTRVETRKQCLVSHLVLEAFVCLMPSPKHHAAHWDRNLDNNKLSNLRWATPAENAADRERHGTMLRGKAHPNYGKKICQPCI